MLDRRRAAVALLGAGLFAAVVGCQSAPSPQGQATGTGTPPVVPAVSFASSVPDKAINVRPDTAVRVSAKNGELRSVVLAGAGGPELRGEVADGVWRLRDTLSPGQKYTMTVTGTDASGTPRRSVRTFTTLTPRVQATYRVTPDKEVVGVGMPVMVSFDSAVTSPQMRAAIERKLRIRTVPATTGSWGWVSNHQVMWRPTTYWKPKTTIVVSAPLRGMQTGEGKWITQDKGAAFSIRDRARISTVNLASHDMVVRENGKVVGAYPISGGKPYGTYETRSGTKVVTEKKRFMVMDAATLGVPKDDPNYYRTEVNYAMRVTNTGEFLHSAPWSVWAQGRRNVSHGCVNLGPRAAERVFRDSMVGDVVDFTGSDRPMKPGDGLSVWLYDAAQWRAKSALAPKPPRAPERAPTSGSAPSATTGSPAAAPAVAAAPRV